MKDEIYGTYGDESIPCTVWQAQDRLGMIWYAVEGSMNVNLTAVPLKDEVSVELEDGLDSFNWTQAICSIEDLQEAIA